jgi:hypothetical protein
MLVDIPMSIKMNHKTFPEIKNLSLGKKIHEEGILALLDFINHRYDCSDFRMIPIIRSLYCYKDLISEDTVYAMKKTVLGFKYRMEDPGIDGMCFWSENHQLIFSTVEYLAGHLYENETFINTQKHGIFHKDRAYKNLLYWFKTRFDLGFVEFHSNTYYEEDIAPLSLLIDLAPDEDIKKQATILMDLILLDIALHQYKGFFSAASGRCYEDQKINPYKQDVLDIIKKAFDLGPIKDYDYTRLSADFIINQTYQVPEVIKKIAHHQDKMIIKDSHGLNLHEVIPYFKGSKDLMTTGMYFWSMESFSNVESIDLTMTMFHDWKLKHNTFLKNLDTFDHALLKKLHIMKPLLKVLNPTTQGVAIQRGDVYTFKHPDYVLSTAQMHVPKTFGDQQHIGGALLDHDMSVFITHPASAFFEDNSRNFSPSYWVGNGIMPYAFQDENQVLYYYDLSPRKGMFEKKRFMFTHLYVDTTLFDEVIYADNLLIGKKNKSLIAIHSLKPMIRYTDKEYRQYGKHTAWSMTLQSTDEISYQSFVSKMKELTIIKHRELVQCGPLSMNTKDMTCYVNDVKTNIRYKRFETPFITESACSEQYVMSYDNLRLKLHLKEMIRDEYISS